MKERSRTKFRVLIIGGGIAGFAAAIGIRRKGHQVTVLERTAGLQTFGGSLLISANALRIIDDYELLETFKAAKENWDVHTVYRYDGKVLDILNNTAHEQAYGYEMLSMERPTYQRLLFEGALKEGVDIRFNSLVAQVDEKVPSVTLTNGEVFKTDLLIGADGIKSTIRPAVLGGSDVQLIPNSTCYQCNISASVMKSNPLTASLISKPGIQSWWGSNRHFICGTKKNGAIYSPSFFIHPTVSEPPPFTPFSPSSLSDISVPNGRNSDRQGDINDIRQNVDDFEPCVKAFVAMIKPEDCLLWKVAALPDLRTWISPSGKVTVVGDAAHAMVPHLGQGAAVTIEDGGCLAECIDRAMSVEDIPRALGAYEKIRKERSEKIKAAALQSGAFKTTKNGPAQLRRDQGFEERLLKGPKYNFWRANRQLGWIYNYDFKKSSKEELDKVFGAGEAIERSRI